MPCQQGTLARAVPINKQLLVIPNPAGDAGGIRFSARNIAEGLLAREVLDLVRELARSFDEVRCIVPMNGLIAERGAIKKSDHLACQGIPFVGDPADRSQELDAASALGADEKHWTLCRRRNL